MLSAVSIEKTTFPGLPNFSDFDSDFLVKDVEKQGKILNARFCFVTEVNFLILELFFVVLDICPVSHIFVIKKRRGKLSRNFLR